MSGQGIPWDRSIVANLENGRRASVSVDEWFALAYVLEVPPISLLVSPDPDAPYMATPTVETNAGRIEPWVVGSLPLPGVDPRAYGADRSRERWAPEPEERRAYLRAVYPELSEVFIYGLAAGDPFASAEERDRLLRSYARWEPEDIEQISQAVERDLAEQERRSAAPAPAKRVGVRAKSVRTRGGPR
jgi:hypothetical protein